MNKILKPLFLQWLESYKDTLETQNTLDVFCEGKDIDESNAKYNMLAETINEERKTAFNAGFKTAVQLLMGGVQ